MYNYGKQNINKEDIQSVTKVLKNNLITQGQEVKKFEKNLSSYFGSKYCTAVSNGTAALHLIGLSLGWKKGDIILCSPITFMSSVNSVLYCNATPDFVDIDIDTHNLCSKKLEEKILFYKKKGKKIKAVIVTDFAGYPADWQQFSKLKKKYNFQLVNDNCHAMGASYNDSKHYASRYADAASLSFHAVKNITTGEGGAILTNNKKIFDISQRLRSHGVVKKKYWHQQMIDLGYNYRLTDFQSSLGSSQIKRLDTFVKKKNYIANYYNKEFKNLKCAKTPIIKNNINHSYHLYTLLVDFKKLKIKKEKFINHLLKKGVKIQVHYYPVYLQPYYKKNFKFKKGYCNNAEKYYEDSISLPIYYNLQLRDLKKICVILKKNIK
jgi:dTDP-4-amino-4,6-dideoxygalactose transaminase